MKTWGNPGNPHADAVAAIHEVIVAYCRFVDTFEDDAMVELFTPDGEWLRPGKEPLRGREEILAYLRTRDRGAQARHVPTNVMVDVADSTSDLAPGKRIPC